MTPALWLHLLFLCSGTSGLIRYDQGAALLESRRLADGATTLRKAVELLPDSAEAHNDLGGTLASMGRIADARPHFERAVALKPDFAEARRNLDAARRHISRSTGQRSGS
jgi:Flp pilus assembly protein TadD